MAYYYIKTESYPDLFTVGCDDANGNWHPDSDHGTREEAAKRVRYLNGDDYPEAFEELYKIVFSTLEADVHPYQWVAALLSDNHLKPASDSDDPDAVQHAIFVAKEFVKKCDEFVKKYRANL